MIALKEVEQSAIPRKLPFVTRRTKRGYLLYNIETGCVQAFDEFSMSILNTCDSSRTFEKILEELSNEYEANVSEIRRDVENFLLQMAREGFVELGSDGS